MSVTGAVLRTSHVTGMFTDLGIVLGQRARGAPYDPIRSRECGAVIASFIAGDAAGASSFYHLAGRGAFIPAIVAAACGLWTAWPRPKASSYGPALRTNVSNAVDVCSSVKLQWPSPTGSSTVSHFALPAALICSGYTP